MQMDTTKNNLQRFVTAQETTYPAALAEIKRARKRSHWMWFIFPQAQGLGFSETSRFYAIKDLAEAAEYLNHPLLGKRLTEICRELLKLETSDANSVFGSPDDVKLKSCMTLFDAVPGSDTVFASVLKKFFHGYKDERTLQIIGRDKK